MTEDVTSRNLIDTDIGPLRRFTGILDSIPTENKTYGEGESARVGVVQSFNFKDIDVKQAVETYHFPIFTINISRSNKRKSKHGFFCDGAPGDTLYGFNNIADMQYSPDQLDPSSPNFIKPKDRMDIKDAIGKRWGLVVADGEEGRPASPMLYDGRIKEDKPTPVWTVYMLEGIGQSSAGGASPMQLAIGLLDGKTLSEFNKAAFENQAVKDDIELLTAISMPPSAPTSFANTMLTSKQFTKDENEVYHKV